MPTSRHIAQFEKPSGTQKISRGTLAYICARARQHAYTLLIREFRKSGLTQADFARRWGKPAEVVSRLLNNSGNVEINTLSGAVFALNGGLLTLGVAYPLQSAGVQKLESRLPLSADTTDKPFKASGVITGSEVRDRKAAFSFELVE